MGSTAVLVDGARLGLDEAADNPKSKKKVCLLSKPIRPADFDCSFRRTVETRFGLLQPVPQQATKRALGISTLHWHLKSLSMVCPKQSTSLTLQQRCAES
jgi:hypothetical protein